MCGSGGGEGEQGMGMQICSGVWLSSLFCGFQTILIANDEANIEG